MKSIKKIIKNILLQCYKMDKLGLNKEEMHHPVKHIIINKKGNPVLIDFERCRFTKKPKNVTQFCQFLMSGKLGKYFNIDKKHMIKLCRHYKKEITKKNLDKIIDAI